MWDLIKKSGFIKYCSHVLFHIPFCLGVCNCPYRSVLWAKYFIEFVCVCVFGFSSLHNLCTSSNSCYLGRAVTGQEKRVILVHLCL